jgi:hypothetical protein
MSKHQRRKCRCKKSLGDHSLIGAAIVHSEFERNETWMVCSVHNVKRGPGTAYAVRCPMHGLIWIGCHPIASDAMPFADLLATNAVSNPCVDNYDDYRE